MTKQNPITRAIEVMWAALITPTTHMPVWVGGYGGGKTTCARVLADELAKAKGWTHEHRFLAWRAAQRAPEDMGGWPTPRPHGLVFEPPYRLLEMIRAKGGVLFLDEMSGATAEKQDGMLSLIFDREVGDFRLEGIALMGAMNPPQASANGQDIAGALANRVDWLPFPKVTPEAHADFIGRGGIGEQADLRPLDMKAWTDAYGMVAGVYRRFVTQVAPGALHENPDSDEVKARFAFMEDGAGRMVFPAFGSPRSWEAAVRYAATCVALDDDDALQQHLAGTVGPHGLDFAAAVMSNDLVDCNELLDGKACFTHDPARPDVTFAQLQALAITALNAHYSEQEREARWVAAWNVLDTAFPEDMGRECGALAAQELGRNIPGGLRLGVVAKQVLKFRSVLDGSVQ